MGILLGLGMVVAGIIIYWLILTVKALKDPDIHIATDLRMSITRYRKYQRLYDDYQAFMLEHGVNSPASEKKFAEIFRQIENPNEWRRYQAYRERKQREEFMNEIYNFNPKKTTSTFPNEQD